MVLHCVLSCFCGAPAPTSPACSPTLYASPAPCHHLAFVADSWLPRRVRRASLACLPCLGPAYLAGSRACRPPCTPGAALHSRVPPPPAAGPQPPLLCVSLSPCLLRVPWHMGHSAPVSPASLLSGALHCWPPRLDLPLGAAPVGSLFAARPPVPLKRFTTPLAGGRRAPFTRRRSLAPPSFAWIRIPSCFPLERCECIGSLLPLSEHFCTPFPLQATRCNTTQCKLAGCRQRSSGGAGGPAASAAAVARPAAGARGARMHAMDPPHSVFLSFTVCHAPLLTLPQVGHWPPHPYTHKCIPPPLEWANGAVPAGWLQTASGRLEGGAIPGFGPFTVSQIGGRPNSLQPHRPS